MRKTVRATITLLACFSMMAACGETQSPTEASSTQPSGVASMTAGTSAVPPAAEPSTSPTPDFASLKYGQTYDFDGVLVTVTKPGKLYKIETSAYRDFTVKLFAQKNDVPRGPAQDALEMWKLVAADGEVIPVEFGNMGLGYPPFSAHLERGEKQSYGMWISPKSGGRKGSLLPKGTSIRLLDSPAGDTVAAWS
jgi:hypothetical protein